MKHIDYKSVELEHFPDPQSKGAGIRWLISQADGAPNFAMRVFEVEPGAASPFHTHAWEHEAFILAGNGHLRAVDGETPFQEGDVVFVAPEEKHQFVNDGDSALRFICVVPL